jgi:hypothetical protein
MQLTSAPIKDIAERPQLFAPFFEKLRLEDIPANAPKVLKDLCGIFQTGKVSYPKISALIPNLLAQKDEPYINLTI